MSQYGNGFRGSIRNSFYRWKRIVSAFLIDETVLQIGPSKEALLWVAVVESIHKQILGVYISGYSNNMMVVEAFLNSLTTVYSDGGCCIRKQVSYLDY